MPIERRRDCDVFVQDTLYCEEQWTKGDIFKSFRVISANYSQYGLTTQLWAALWLIQVNARSRSFLQTWERLMANYHLVSGEQSIVPNPAGLRKNRHDQNLFSMLLKGSSRAIGHACGGTHESQHTWQQNPKYGVEGLKVCMMYTGGHKDNLVR